MRVKLFESMFRGADCEAGELLGVHLIAEDEREKELLRRCFDGGIKNNGITNDGDQLCITRADLIGKDLSLPAAPSWQVAIGSRVFHRQRDLFGKVISLDYGIPQTAMVKYELPWDPKAPAEAVPVSELDAASNWE